MEDSNLAPNSEMENAELKETETGKPEITVTVNEAPAPAEAGEAQAEIPEEITGTTAAPSIKEEEAAHVKPALKAESVAEEAPAEIAETIQEEIQSSVGPEAQATEVETPAAGEAVPEEEAAAKESTAGIADLPVPESLEEAGPGPVAEPVAEIPAEEAPVEETPVGEAPLEESSVAEVPLIDEPAPKALVAEASVDEAPVEEAPVTEAMAEAPPEAPEEQPVIVSAAVSEAFELSSALHEEEISAVLEETEDLLEEEEEEPVAAQEDFDKFTKQQLVETMEAAVREEDLNRIKTRVALLRVAYLKVSKEERQKLFEQFIAAGGVKEEYVPAEDPLEERFKEAFNIYKDRKSKFNQEQEKIKLQNLEAKNAILEELKVLVNSEENLKKTYDEFRALQEKWKEIGIVPRNEVNNLWQSYHFLVEKFFDKVRINKELKDLDLKKNLEAKILLCEKVEELLLETSIMRSFKQLQKYHEEWKEIGPVPLDKKDEIWERFKTATDKINEGRREYYDKVQGEQENNIIAKTALCEKAEEVLSGESNSIREYTDKTKQLNELLKLWRTVGPGPKKQNDEIWARFKTCLDSFFANKKEYFDKLKEQQVNNFNLKLDLCVQAESLKDSNDWRQTTRDLINLQNEWKKIGPVPRKHSEKIWKRFRAACDEFFKKKSDYFSNINKFEEENLQKKLELISKVEVFESGGSKSENLDMLKDFQRQFMEIGHVPIKEKEKLQNDFRAAINKQLDKLKINSAEMSAMSYRSRVENIKNSPDAYRTLQRESNVIISKIMKLKEDISLWENNIGFLAESRNAQLLKEEFNKKIASAKSEIVLLEVKLKYLKEAK